MPPSTPQSFGRRLQSRIFERGIFGHHQPVPVQASVLERKALAHLSHDARAYVRTGAGNGSTMQANRDAFDRWRIVPRLMRDVGRRDTSIELFGRRHPSPFLTCPIGVLELAHPDADLAVARAAQETGTPMIISSQASWPMEQIADELGERERWFQLYWSNEDSIVESFVQRAERCGCSAIVVTLDTMVLSWRPEDLDRAYLPFTRALGIAQYTSDLQFQRIVDERLAAGDIPKAHQRPTPRAMQALLSIARHHPGEFRDNLTSPLPQATVRTFLDAFSRATLTWGDLGWLRRRTSLPIVVKGLQSPDDARLALEHGADGIIVSNHGGRQLDGAIGSLDALPAIVAEVDGRVPVLFDSGVRCAADAFKALALGADAVCLGRPYLYGLALAGEKGVRAVLEHFRAELDLTMAVAGVASIGQITREALGAGQFGAEPVVL